MQDQSVAAPRVRFGPFELDLRAGELKKGPTRLKVPDQSIQVLEALLDCPGELVTREQLQQRLWPSNTFVDFEHGLNVAIRRLREALGDSADEPKYIETLPRRGYRFVGAIDDAPGSVAPLVALPMRIRSRHLATFAAVVLATGVVVLWSQYRLRDREPSAPRTPARSIPVTSMPGLEVAPALSPDGNYVAFAWQKDNPDIFDLYVKLIDGGDPVQLTRGPDRNGSPAWSPDGHRIAFVRGRPGHGTVIIIPAFGGPEQVVTETEAAPANGVGWTPDGDSLVIVDRAPPSAGAIFLCSRDTAERRQLTHPTRDFYDGNPAVSPDGHYLAFVRRIAGFSGGRVFVQPLDGLQPAGEPRPLTQDFSTNALDWAADSRSIIFDGKQGLWRAAVEGGDPLAILTNVHATHPSVARDGSRLVYSRRLIDDSNIWMIRGPQLHDRGELREATRLIDSTFPDGSPQFSYEGDRIAFVSGRTGPNEIWVSRSDGSQQMKLTTIGAAAGSPRWSPDGTAIAFDSMHTGSWNIYVVGSRGGAVRPITRDGSNNVRPSWSRDGKWIYFGSNRGGDMQIWKIPAGGGAPVQITMQGGLEAFESLDGGYLYYTRQRPRFRGVWRVPVDGGAEVQVLDRGIEGSWAVTQTGIFMMQKDRVPKASVEFFDFATREITTIHQFAPWLHFDMNNPSFAVSRDGQRILYVQFDQWGADIEMLNLR